mgnify:FL=1
MRDIFYIKDVCYAVFLDVYVVNINLPNIFTERKFHAFMDADFDAFVKSISGKALDIKNSAKTADFL